MNDAKDVARIIGVAPCALGSDLIDVVLGLLVTTLDLLRDELLGPSPTDPAGILEVGTFIFLKQDQPLGLVVSRVQYLFDDGHPGSAAMKNAARTRETIWIKRRETAVCDVTEKPSRRTVSPESA